MKWIGNFDMSLADITSVIAGTGLSGGGTTGAVTLNVDASIPEITTLAGLTAIGTASATLTTTSYSVFDVDRTAAQGNAGAENITALHVDFDRESPESGTYAHNDRGIDLDVTSASLGESSLYGMDIDVRGAASGTSTAVGIDLTVGGADTNDGMYISSTSTQLKLLFNATNYAEFLVNASGDMDISTTGSGTTDSDISLSADGKILLTPANISGTVFKLDGNAAADNVVDIDAGILDIDVTGASYLDTTYLWLNNPTTSSATEGGQITLINKDGGATGDDHRLGVVEFRGMESANTSKIGAQIEAFADAAWATDENGGRLVFSTNDADDDLRTALTIDSDLLATFAGAVTVTGALTGTLATASQTNITGVGTIDTGVWEGTAVASAYLDADTAHYSAQRQMTYHMIKDDIGTGVIYIGLNEADAENASKSNKYLPFIAPVAGKLLKVFLRTEVDMSASGHDTNLTWRLLTRAASATTAGNVAVIGTQSGAGPTASSMATYDFTSSLDSGTNVIAAGDKVQLSIQSDATSEDTLFFITCLWEWDLS